LTVDNIDVEATIKKVQQLLAEEAHLSSALRTALEVLIILVQLLANRLSINSRNSSKPPSTDRFNKGDKDNNDGDNQKQGNKNKPGALACGWRLKEPEILTPPAHQDAPVNQDCPACVRQSSVSR
jgi:hypothetical protein